MKMKVNKFGWLLTYAEVISVPNNHKATVR